MRDLVLDADPRSWTVDRSGDDCRVSTDHGLCCTLPVAKGTVHLRSCRRVHHWGFDDEGVVGHRVQKAECPIDDDSQVVDALLCQGLGLPRGLVVRRFVVLFIAVLAFVLAPWPATAAPPDNFRAQIDLPDGFFPEGIESGRGTTVFVGSLTDGAIWRGDVRTGSGAVLADGAAGRVSVGIAYEAGQNRLWVAGGGPGFFGAGDVRVYDASSGDLLATFTFEPGAVGFLNDVAITHDAVYVTDSFNPQLVKIPLPADGSLPSTSSATLLPVTGNDFVPTPGVPNLHGIVYKGGVLIVAQSNTGELFRVDPTTGDATPINIGVNVTLESVDGLELQGRTL